MNINSTTIIPDAMPPEGLIADGWTFNDDESDTKPETKKKKKKGKRLEDAAYFAALNEKYPVHYKPVPLADRMHRAAHSVALKVFSLVVPIHVFVLLRAVCRVQKLVMGQIIEGLVSDWLMARGIPKAWLEGNGEAIPADVWNKGQPTGHGSGRPKGTGWKQLDEQKAKAAADTAVFLDTMNTLMALHARWSGSTLMVAHPKAQLIAGKPNAYVEASLEQQTALQKHGLLPDKPQS